MSGARLDGSPRTCGAVRSLEAHVVPQLVDVTAGSHGIVISLAVAPGEVVHRGQPVATLESLSAPGQRGGHVAVEAPVAGLVTRCWAMVGDVVSGSWPIMSISSPEDVMVVGRFSPDDAARIPRGAPANVVFHAADRATVPGTVVSVIEAVEPCAPEGAPDRRGCVVVSLLAAPPEVLWPGRDAEVEIAVTRWRARA
jgi:multidrug resistance efflux pump